MRIALPIGIVLLVSACGGGEQNANPIPWGRDCPSYIGATAECAFVDAPLDWADPNGRQIRLFTYRVPGASSEKRAQVWFVQGGPGVPGVAFVPFFEDAARAHPEFDYYTVDQRGTGNSTNLRCPPGTEEDTVACARAIRATWGDTLATFSTTQAARDLHFLVERERASGRAVYLYGVSYGTYLLHRFLQLYPDGVDGVILDSVATPGYAHLDELDAQGNEAAHQVMDLCAADGDCRARMATVGPTPWQATGAVLDELERGALCAPFRRALTPELYRALLTIALEDAVGRVAIPAAVYRLRRCNEGDQRAIAHLLTKAGLPGLSGGAFVPEEDLRSVVIDRTISLSELWGGKSLPQLLDEEEALFVSNGDAIELAGVRATGEWPVYQDPLADGRASTRVPVLMLNSTIDPATPLAVARHATEIFRGIDQRLVVVPQAGHGVAFSAPPRDPSAPPCGTTLLFGFLDDPTAPTDTACLGGLYQLEWSDASPQDRLAAQAYFGTDSLWE